VRSSGALVEQHNNHFGRRTEDVEWLPFVGSRQWVLVTADKKIRKRAFERETLINAGVRAFVLASGNLNGSAITAILTDAMPAMLKLIAEQPPPFIARISQTASIQLLYPPKSIRPVTSRSP
jgi:PIN domain-containing protein